MQEISLFYVYIEKASTTADPITFAAKMAVTAKMG